MIPPYRASTWLNAAQGGTQQGVRGGVGRQEGYQSVLCGDAGRGTAVLELGDPSSGKKGLSMTGFKSWVAWRSAYLTRLGNMRNRLYVMVCQPVLS